MLPGRQRITRGDDFARVVRRGVRAGSRTVVVHLLVEPSSAEGDRRGERGEPRAGFVVSRAVGGAVTRNRVVRRLRHAMRELMPDLPAGSLVVVRALPAAVPGPGLLNDVRSAVETAVRRAG